MTVPVQRGAPQLPADLQALLERSNERDAYLHRILQAEQESYRRGLRAGYEAGYADGELSAHRHMTGAAREHYSDSGSWPQRVRAAEAGGKRDADQHWRDFVRRSYRTPDHMRTAPQRACLGMELPR